MKSSYIELSAECSEWFTSESIAKDGDLESDSEKPDHEQFVSEDAHETSSLEPWANWTQRTTHDVEDKCKQLDICTWVEKARS